MKKLTVLLVLIVFTIVSVLAQSPNEFKYQAALRNSDGTIMSEKAVKVDISILKGSATGTEVFAESHNTTTSKHGIINLNIGSVANMSFVNWGDDKYFVKIAVDNIVMGISQLLSVPYAINSKTAESVANSDNWDKDKSDDFSGDYDELTNKPTIFDGDYNNLTNAPNTANWDKDASDDFSGSYTDLTDKPASTSFDGDMENNKITNLANPTDDKDAVNKKYVDALILILDSSGLFTVNFSSDKQTISKDESINFTDESNINSTSWSWDFGDGNSSAEENPTYTYNTPGTYTVKLTASNDIMSKTKEKIDYIVVTETITSVTDIDGNVYPTVKIGNQVWMRENLKTTRYADGTNITGYYSYDNDESNDANGYGKLYTWGAASNGVSSNTNPSGVQGVCPDGWHLPSHREWTKLELAVCAENGHSDCWTRFPYDETTTGYLGSDEGTSLKTVANDKFSGLLAGYRRTNGSFSYRATSTNFWTSTVSGSNAWRRYLNSSEARVYRYSISQAYGFAVRCLKD